MKTKAPSTAPIFVLLIFVALLCSFRHTTSDPLPSWSEGPNKSAIIQFVQSVTNQNGPHFIPIAERIATFDNDGTLWPSHPMSFVLFFAFDRIHKLASEHPEWKNTQPFKAALEGDIKTFTDTGEKGLMALIMATHAGMTNAEFEKLVLDWLATAKHPRFDRPFTALAYQPMLELLQYLRANNFKTYIVSGSSTEFMRPWTEKVYGIPPEQVIGTSIKTKYEFRNGEPVLVRLPEENTQDAYEGKPININEHIGRRPVLAFGNSDGDQQMLEWTAAGSGKSFMGLIHHTDAVREYAYDRSTHYGRLEKALDEARKREWNVIDMKNDWKVIFSQENTPKP